MSQAALVIEQLHKAFGDHKALAGIDLSLPPGEVLALLGPSGCGKTTLLRCIAGLTRLDSGRILIAGETVAQPQRQLAPDERKLGMVFQDYALWPHMNVAQNVAFPLQMQGVGASECARQVEWALSLVGLGDHAKRPPGALSGGQQQRVALARAVVARPRLLLMDEPLSNLDKRLRENLALEIRQLIKSLSLTVVLVTHDQHEAFALADRVAVLQAGRLSQIATPETLYRHPATAEIARFIDAGTQLTGRLDAKGLHLAGQILPLWAASGAGGEVEVLLPRRGLKITAPGQGHLLAQWSGALFQGDYSIVTLALGGGASLSLHLPCGAMPAPVEQLGIAVDLETLRAWRRADGHAVALSAQPPASPFCPAPEAGRACPLDTAALKEIER